MPNGSIDQQLKNPIHVSGDADSQTTADDEPSTTGGEYFPAMSMTSEVVVDVTLNQPKPAATSVTCRAPNPEGWRKQYSSLSSRRRNTTYHGAAKYSTQSEIASYQWKKSSRK